MTILRAGFLWTLIFLFPGWAAGEVWHPLETDFDLSFASSSLPPTLKKNVYIAPVGVLVPDTGETLSQSNSRGLRIQFEQQLDSTLTQQGFRITTDPNEADLVLKAQIIDMKTNPPQGLNPWSNKYRFRIESGHYTLVAQWQDAKTQQVLLRAADLGSQQEDLEAWSERLGDLVKNLEQNSLASR